MKHRGADEEETISTTDSNLVHHVAQETNTRDKNNPRGNSRLLEENDEITMVLCAKDGRIHDENPGNTGGNAMRD